MQSNAISWTREMPAIQLHSITSYHLIISHFSYVGDEVSAQLMKKHGNTLKTVAVRSPLTQLEFPCP